MNENSPDQQGTETDVLALRAEIEVLRSRLAEAPRRSRQLEERLAETQGLLTQEASKNEKLSFVLREARENIVSLREEVDKLSQPPSAYGVVVGKNDDRTVDVLTSGRKLKVNLNPEIDFELLERGAEVVLNESFNVVTSRRSEGSGDVVSIRELLADGIRAIVVGRNDEESVCELADALRGVLLRSGDTVRRERKFSRATGHRS